MDIKIMTKLENKNDGLAVTNKESVNLTLSKTAKEFVLNRVIDFLCNKNEVEHYLNQTEWNLISVDATSFMLEPLYLEEKVLVLAYKGGVLQFLSDSPEVMIKKGESLPAEVKESFEELLSEVNEKFNRVKSEMKITNFKVKRRILSIRDYKNFCGNIVVEDAGDMSVDVQLPEVLQNYIFDYFKESKSYREAVAKEIVQLNFALTRYIGIKGWVLESLGNFPFRIYFDDNKFILSSEEKTNAVDINQAHFLKSVLDVLESITNVFSDYIDDDILNQPQVQFR